MTNRDDQDEPGTEAAESSGSEDELELPDLDADDLQLTAEKPAGADADAQLDIDELDGVALDGVELDGIELDGVEMDEIDPDIIDISDEEVQQEFEKMEQEEQIASEPSKETATSEPSEAADEPEAGAQVQAELLDLVDTKDSKPEVEASDSMIETDIPDVEIDTDTQAQGGGRLSPKIIYGSLSATVVVVAVILFVGFGADEPVIADASPAAAAPAIVADRDAADTDAAATQAAVEEEFVAVAEEVDTAIEAPSPVAEAPVAEATVFVDEQTELEAAPEIIETAPTASTEILLAAADIEPLDVQADVDEPSTVAATPATGSSGDADAAVETDAADSEVVAVPSASAASSTEIVTLSASTGDFYIVVASFLTESKAREHARSLLKNQNTPTILSPFDASRRYRVTIAGYETMAEVQTNIAQFKSKYGDDIWPLRYISVGSTTLLSAATGNIYVIVFSFLTEELARKHADTLAAAGENPSIIPPFDQGRQYRVAVSDYATLSSAQAALVQHREEFGNETWLLRY
jgi:hypothetical protein